MTSTRTILYAGTYERDYPRNRQLIRLLKRSGCDVHEIHEPFWERFRDKSRGIGGTTVPFRLIWIYLKLVMRLIPRLGSADAVAIGYIGQVDMLILGLLARLARRPVIFNPLVTLTDTIVEDRALLSSGSLLARVIAFIDWVALRLASVIVVDTKENADYLADRFQVERSRIAQIHVGADESVFSSEGHSGSSEEALHVLFYGKMIPLHGIETILGAIERIQEQGQQRVTFELIGQGQEECLLHAFQRRHPDAPVIYRPWVAYPRLAQRIAVADCVLGVFGEGEKAGRVVPNKVFQAMAMGAPIITRESPAIERVLEHAESVLLVPPGDPEALANAIQRLQDPDLRGRLGSNARAAFERHGSDGALGARVGDLLKTYVPAAGHGNQPGRSR